MLFQSQPFVLDDHPNSVENGGYPMIKSLNISNFRGFNEIELDNLEHVSLAVESSERRLG